MSDNFISGVGADGKPATPAAGNPSYHLDSYGAGSANRPGTERWTGWGGSTNNTSTNNTSTNSDSGSLATNSPVVQAKRPAPKNAAPGKKGQNEAKPTSARKLRQQKRRDARDAWRSSGIGWRVFPRTLIGIVVAILMFSAGAGTSGAILFAYYEARVADSENKITEFSSGLDERIAEGVSAVETASSTASQRLSAVLGPYSELVQNEGGIPRVAGPVAPSTVLIETRDLEGRPVFGTAVSVGKDGDRTLFVAAFDVVEAASADPGPEIVLRRGDDRWVADLLSWDENIGVALLISDADLPAAPFAPVDNLGVLVGSPVFAISSLNDAVSPGAVVAVTADGFRHTGVVAADFAGGPIVGQDGKVVGFSVPDYSPDGIPGGALPWSPTVTQICDTLLVCENSGTTARD